MNVFAFSIELSAFLVGILFGSFLNVCIARLPRHRSIITPRSQCPACHSLIHWYDNLPLLSFMLLGAKCRNCRARIPWQYPLVELAVGLWFAFVAWRAMQFLPQWFSSAISNPMNGFGTGAWESTAILALLGFLLIGLLVMDWKTHTLPDAFTLTGTALGFVLCCVQAFFLPTGVGDIHLHPSNSLRMSSPGSMSAQGDVFMTGPEALVFSRMGAILAAAGLILLLRWLYKTLRHRQGLGLGDAKLMALLAAFLGFWPSMLAFFVGILLAAFYAVILLARRRANSLTQLPLGSFLCIGGFVAALWGEPLLAWYRSLL